MKPTKRQYKTGGRQWKIWQEDALYKAGYSSYHEYLATDLWRGISDQVLKDHSVCQCCLRKPSVVVHHCWYTVEILLGQENEGLMALCKGCHYIGHFTWQGNFIGPGKAAQKLKRKRKNNLWFGLGFAERKDPVTDIDWLEEHFLLGIARD